MNILVYGGVSKRKLADIHKKADLHKYCMIWSRSATIRYSLIIYTSTGWKYRAKVSHWQFYLAVVLFYYFFNKKVCHLLEDVFIFKGTVHQKKWHYAINFFSSFNGIQFHVWLPIFFRISSLCSTEKKPFI